MSHWVPRSLRQLVILSVLYEETCTLTISTWNNIPGSFDLPTLGDFCIFALIGNFFQAMYPTNQANLYYTNWRHSCMYATTCSQCSAFLKPSAATYYIFSVVISSLVLLNPCPDATRVYSMWEECTRFITPGGPIPKTHCLAPLSAALEAKIWAECKL